jgi:hypothetical protein
MKIEIKINDKPFKKTRTYDVLYTVLCVVRVLCVVLLLLIPMLLSLLIFLPLGSRNIVSKWIVLFEGLAFNEPST